MIDTMLNNYAASMLTAALNHNALVVRYASEIVASSQTDRPDFKKIRRQFEEIHEQYKTEVNRINSIIGPELKREGVEL